MKKKISQFRNEDEERDFWQSHDSTGYVDWKKAKKTNPCQFEALRKNNFFAPS
jgi:hypothetical protein